MNVRKQDLIIALSAQMRGVLKKPDWAEYVKTGVHKERPPLDPDWWYVRGASILLKVQKLQPIGISKLRTKYGGRKNRGVAPEHFFKGSGNIARKLVQQLEKAGYLKQATIGKHKGRVITPKAESLIAKTAKSLAKAAPAKKESHAVHTNEA